MSKHSRRENRQFRKSHPRGRSKARRVALAAYKAALAQEEVSRGQ